MHTFPSRRRLFPATLLVFVIAVFAGLRGTADEAPRPPLDKEAYITPPKVIADVILAARENIALTNLSPDGKKFLIARTDGLPTIERMARPCVHLGEMAFDPVAHRAHQLYVRSSPGYDLFYHADRRKVAVQVPPQARVSNPVWSPDGAQLAFYAHFQDGTFIYVADTVTGQSRKLTQTPVLATLATTVQWSRDGKRIQTVLVPDNAGSTPTNPPHADLKVRVAQEGKFPSRTYRYLLESPQDMKLFEHLVTGQLAFVDLADGKVTKVGAPGMIRSVSMSPSGEQFRVTVMKKPFSYFVPADRFGSIEGIWNREGKSLFTLADKKLRETEPQPPAVTTGPVVKGFGKKGMAKGTPPTPAPTPVDPDNPQTAKVPTDPEGKRDLGWRPDGMGLSFLQSATAQVNEEKKPADAKKSTDEQTTGDDKKISGDKKPAGDKKPTDAKKAGDDKQTQNDRVMVWLPPFGKDSMKVVYETPHKIAGVQYSEDCRWVFVTQTVDSQRQIVAVDLKDPKTTYVVYKAGKGGMGAEPDMESPFTPEPSEFPNTRYDHEQQFKKGGFKGGAFGGFGAGGLPGLMTRTGRGEGKVVRMSPRGEVYVAGTDRTGGAALPRPYIDRIDIKTGEKKRVFAGKSELLETIDAVDGDEIATVFVTRQKKDVVPDSYRIDLATGKEEKLTTNVDPAPWFHQLQVQRFQVTRVDGFKFWVKVTTAPKAPPKQPALFWIYPREYVDQAAYSKTGGKDFGKDGDGKGGGPGRFTVPSVRSMSLLTLLGYAVVEPDVPIVGPAGRMNDNYVADLRNSLWAVIDELDKRSLIDRDRLAIGGHSYGAFSTANALVHTPFFKAGIAGDGNYNRTLTPMSFQTEKRHLWEARETYLEMSPLLWADRLNGALLMYHGMEDANVGTHPMNADHLFNALRGLGKPAALYMYPYEAHGPLALETTLDQWARWTAWLDTYVMNPQKKK
jgi:dipeptidyl aminopeptidase/acylaminoacyl peptidase